MLTSCPSAPQIEEKEFLETVTQTDRVVVHFFHRDFERCKIADKHLGTLANKYFRTRFIKISVSASACPYSSRSASVPQAEACPYGPPRVPSHVPL